MKHLVIKNVAFSALLIIIIGAIINRVTPPHVDPVFSMVVSKNRVNITNIHQVRDIEISKTIMVDRINLADKSRFRHVKLGDLGFENDFFVDFDAPFTVKIAGAYQFFVGSDDGFVLSVDDKQLCEWTHDRPLTINNCPVNLTQGEHRFRLSYFQGYGNAGLVMSYALASGSAQYVAGENSKYFTFAQ
jgi:hypothetical protein